jgi:hypothetical protein
MWVPLIKHFLRAVKPPIPAPEVKKPSLRRHPYYPMKRFGIGFNWAKVLGTAIYAQPGRGNSIPDMVNIAASQPQTGCKFLPLGARINLIWN